MPRSLTAFPHVATYSAKKPINILQYWIQTFWKLLDAWLTARAWRRSAAYNNQRRAQRGLPNMPDGWRGYLQRYPVISFGGVAPFMNANSRVALNVTVVGSLDSNQMTPIKGDLKEWLDKHSDHGIVYAGFGTGTVLSNKEASTITSDLVHYNRQNGGKTLPPLLFALRASEQKRLRSIFDDALGSSPTSESKTHLEYFHGHLRIQANVPQATLLSSGKVKLFISHMGMEGFVEGVKGGVPLIASHRVVISGSMLNVPSMQVLLSELHTD